MLFRPSVNPDPDKYIQWADSIEFANPNTMLAGPFNVEAILSSNRSRSKVARGGRLEKPMQFMCSRRYLASNHRFFHIQYSNKEGSTQKRQEEKVLSQR